MEQDTSGVTTLLYEVLRPGVEATYEGSLPRIMRSSSSEAYIYDQLLRDMTQYLSQLNTDSLLLLWLMMGLIGTETRLLLSLPELNRYTIG